MQEGQIKEKGEEFRQDLPMEQATEEIPIPTALFKRVPGGKWLLSAGWMETIY